MASSLDGQRPRRIRFGATARRITLAILLTALIPSVSTLFLARTIISRIADTAFQPEFGAHLDRSLGVYSDLVKAVKGGMRAEAEAIGGNDALRASASKRDVEAMNAALDEALKTHLSLAIAELEACDGTRIALRERAQGIDRSRERAFTVRRVLGQGFEDDCEGETGAILLATFAAPSARLAEIEAAESFAQAYHQIEKRRDAYLSRSYLDVFLAVIALTLVLGALAGVLVARPVTQRIARLARATEPVAAGDLSVRVALGGDDEVTALGDAFDRMLEELERSRARIDFLKRMGEWQKMARRLAHEIKNPLTPIQLAVEECHRRYKGDDAAYRRVLDTTHEIVEEEIGSLRRLVSEFANFARLPRAELTSADLGDFLRGERVRLSAFDLAGESDAMEEGASADPLRDEAEIYRGVDVEFVVPDAPMPAAIDREMMHRVLSNLVRNAAQALRDQRGEAGSNAAHGKIRVSAASTPSGYVLTVDDNGPGIAAEVSGTVFDPYVTTKQDGTGLGLSIVKKIVVDHEGTIEASASPLGGARFSITLPSAPSTEKAVSPSTPNG